jgi:ribonuclease E
MVSKDVEEIVVEGTTAFHQIKKLSQVMNPDSAVRIKEHKNKNSIFNFYNIEEAIDNFYNTKVELESGGYLIIDITEALVSVDINSGRATKERSVEGTALKTNLEAAKEIARQLQIRDLSGLIVIDFIDMLELDHKKELERALRKAFENDRARVQVSRVSNFGLVEISRQRLKPSLIETNMVACGDCKGTGIVKSDSTVAVDIFRAVRHAIGKGNVRAVKVYATAETVSYIANYRRKNIAAIEANYKIKLFVYVDRNFRGTEFKVQTLSSIPAEDEEFLSTDEINMHKVVAGAPKGGKKTDTKNKGFVKKIFASM